jgi:hypothetical protein
MVFCSCHTIAKFLVAPTANSSDMFGMWIGSKIIVWIMILYQ